MATQIEALGSLAVVYSLFVVVMSIYSLYLGYKQSLVKKNTEEMIKRLDRIIDILERDGTK